MSKEQETVDGVALDLITLPEELRRPFWMDVSEAYVRALRSAHPDEPEQFIAENYLNFAAAIATRFSALQASGAGPGTARPVPPYLRSPWMRLPAQRLPDRPTSVFQG